jgi:hypothetical protein
MLFINIGRKNKKNIKKMILNIYTYKLKEIKINFIILIKAKY